MAYIRIGTIGRFEGLSSDDKPDNSATDIKEGSQLHELDTGKRFVWSNLRWKEDISGPISVDENAEKQNALRRFAEKEFILNSMISDEPEAAHYNLTEIR